MTHVPMQDPGGYRSVRRKTFVVVMAILLVAVSIATWLGLDRVAAYWAHLEELAATDPREAVAAVSRLMRTLAMLNGAVLSLLAALVIRHGWKGLRTASMPPKGSWILEGQRTWSGKPALRIARFTVAVGILLAVLALASSVILWKLGDSLVEQTAKMAGNGDLVPGGRSR